MNLAVRVLTSKIQSEKTQIKIFVGWDSGEIDAYNACIKSLEENSSTPLEIEPIKRDDLKARGLYQREIYQPYELSSTEFAFTRFLTPRLNNNENWAMFVDCDFIFTRDVNELFDLRDEDKAVMVAKHDYVPKNSTKMNDQIQTKYPRKNWSSMMLFNCEHESCQKLNPRVVSEESGAYLHRFKWCQDDEIGDVSPFWNWLEGEYEMSDDILPGAIHYTQGGPWFAHMAEDVKIDYYEEWLRYCDYSEHRKQEIRVGQEKLRI